jgi:uncharacterized protein YdhG (YjbR/CyaY superfamily)
MAWVKVPPENHPKFQAALPLDPRLETMKMFGGVAAKVNGRIFGGLFGRSVMISLPEPERSTALALEGAALFDPMGDGRVRSDKVMLPERMLDAPDELRAWLTRALEAAAKGREPSPIDGYLARLSGSKRAALETLRKTIRTIVPTAEECISYQMPAFRLEGRVVAGFSATSKGCSYFPFSGSTLKTLAKDLRGYEGTKSALHFDPAKGLPPTIVRKLLRARIAEGRSLGPRTSAKRSRSRAR